MRMNSLKYDVASIHIAPRGQTFYFLYNTQKDFFESFGMDLSSMVYLLLFKLREYGINHRDYVQLLKMEDFDLRNKPYYDEDKLMKLVEDCMKDEYQLFKKREHEIDLSLLDEENELACMAYVSDYNPHRGYRGTYNSFSAEDHALIELFSRESRVDKIMEKIIEVIEKDVNLGKTDPTTVDELFDVNDLNYMITGPNGDLWCELFLMMKIPEKQKYQQLYRARPSLLLENEAHQKEVEYVLCALDGQKDSDERMGQLFTNLPAEIQENPLVYNFYHWHRVKAL